MCDHCGCRAHPPIAELTAEHDVILRLAWQLAEAERAGAAMAPGAHTELLDLLDGHVAKEETGLYPVLVSTGGMAEDRIAGLEDEHRELHRALAGPGFDRPAFYALAAHIEEEEHELFPAAMLGFDEPEWEAMSRAGASRPGGAAAVREQ